LVACLDGAHAGADLLDDDVGVQLAVHGRGLALHHRGDLALGPDVAGVGAGDGAAAAQAADAGHLPRAVAAALDPAQVGVAAGHGQAADVLERPLLVAIDVALAQDVGDRTGAVRLGAQQLEDAGVLGLLD